MKPIILCSGRDGRCLVYGYVQEEPVPGEPVSLEKAKMILTFPSGGTFGLATKGPPEGSSITNAVTKTVETVWQEWIEVSPNAARCFDEWK